MPSLIAVDLGAHAVKVTALRRTGRRYDVEARFSQPVPQDGEAVPNVEARLAALDALLDEHPEWQSPSTEVAAVWPAERATLRRLTLPFTDKAQVEKTLPFAVEAEVPFDLDDVVLAWRVQDVEDDTKALVALVRRDDLSPWLEGLAERQVDPRAVFVDGDVLAGLTEGEELAAVVDVGHAHTVVSVVRGGVMQTTRAVDVGGRDFTRAIQRAEDCTWEEAEGLKHGRLGDGLSPKARQAVDQAMGLLLAEIRSTLITAEDALGDEIVRVFLTGGGARLHPFADYLRQDLGVPVDGFADDDGRPVPPEHAVDHALALRLSGRTAGTEMDLRVDDLAYRGGTDVLRTSATLLLAGVSFLTIAALVVFTVQYRGLGAEEADLDARIQAVVTETLPDVPAASVNMTTADAIMRERVRDAKQRAAVLGAGGGEPPVTSALLALTEAFPPPGEVTVDVDELVVTPTNITLEAETDGYTSASAVEEALQKVARFRTATKGNERKVRNKVSFEINIPLGDDDGEEG